MPWLKPSQQDGIDAYRGDILVLFQIFGENRSLSPLSIRLSVSFLIDTSLSIQEIPFIPTLLNFFPSRMGIFLNFLSILIKSYGFIIQSINTSYYKYIVSTGF